MKILYIITKSNWGGAQRHVFDLATNAKKQGFEVVVALGGNGALRARLEENSISTRTISELGRDVSVGKDAGSFKEIFNIIRREKPDVVHLHSPKAAGLGALSSRILRVKKIIYTVHGWAFNENRPLHEKALIVIFSWLTTLLSHTVILLSEKELGQTLLFPFVKKKTVLIPLGIDSPTFISVDGARQFMAKKIGIAFPDFNKKTVAGTIAELHPNKGLTFLLSALLDIKESHPHVITLLIGAGEQHDQLRDFIAAHGLEQHVYLLGYLESASEYMKAFNIFILPSVKEGLPYTLLEAGYAGLPVITTTVGGIPEIIEDMKSGVLIQPRKPAEIAHAIAFYAEHPDVARQYGRSLNESVKKKFALERMVAETLKVYETKTS
ncbi:MAG TPA: glycosyltransferase family 4 protein [Candidatus Paceibacterota bacterium]|jgi:glycosyltransferase involved in cell wall biosynthesis|nr:glycosyltransferase family 4 protein [Candidatus Paceibacterota bacterium]